MNYYFFFLMDGLAFNLSKNTSMKCSKVKRDKMSCACTCVYFPIEVSLRQMHWAHFLFSSSFPLLLTPSSRHRNKQSNVPRTWARSWHVQYSTAVHPLLLSKYHNYHITQFSNVFLLLIAIEYSCIPIRHFFPFHLFFGSDFY